MKDRPILMSAPMLRARLAGTKNQTRRECTHPLLKELSYIVDCGNGWWGDEEGHVQVRCPYGQPGDRLWVREAWRACRDLDRIAPRDIDPDSSIEYEATRRSYAEIGLTGKLRPGMFMPRWASRITLEITSVRLERLQDISEQDAKAEGVDAGKYHGLERAYARAFSDLWEQINGPGSWDLNPWVWVVEFA